MLGHDETIPQNVSYLSSPGRLQLEGRPTLEILTQAQHALGIVSTEMPVTCTLDRKGIPTQKCPSVCVLVRMSARLLGAECQDLFARCISKQLVQSGAEKTKH